MVDKVHYTWKDIEHMIQNITNLMYADNWRPDYIVGLTRGGLVPADRYTQWLPPVGQLRVRGVALLGSTGWYVNRSR